MSDDMMIALSIFKALDDGISPTNRLLAQKKDAEHWNRLY
jgi:hypothetical protein